MRHPRPTPRLPFRATAAPAPVRAGAPRRGFTLIELLVVISLIALVTGFAFPYMRASLRGASVDMAVGQVNNGVAAARVYATRYKPFVVARRTGNALRTAGDTGDGYSGSIALFAQDGTIRVLENDENAATPTGAWMEFLAPPRNGYSPIEDLEDMTTPGRSFLLGIVRVGSGPEDIRLIPPPFAIRFSREGVLVQGEATSDPGRPAWARYIYVGGSGATNTAGSGQNKVTANIYRTTVWRSSNSVKDGNPDIPGKQLEVADYGRRGDATLSDGRVQVPFDQIETVSGVLVVDPEKVPAEWDGTTTNFNRDTLDIYTTSQSAAILKWAATSPAGRVLFFNRYTGQDLTR